MTEPITRPMDVHTITELESLHAAIVQGIIGEFFYNHVFSMSDTCAKFDYLFLGTERGTDEQAAFVKVRKVGGTDIHVITLRFE